MKEKAFTALVALALAGCTATSLDPLHDDNNTPSGTIAHPGPTRVGYGGACDAVGILEPLTTVGGSVVLDNGWLLSRGDRDPAYLGLDLQSRAVLSEVDVTAWPPSFPATQILLGDQQGLVVGNDGDERIPLAALTKHGLWFTQTFVPGTMPLFVDAGVDPNSGTPLVATKGDLLLAALGRDLVLAQDNHQVASATLPDRSRGSRALDIVATDAGFLVLDVSETHASIRYAIFEAPASIPTDGALTWIAHDSRIEIGQDQRLLARPGGAWLLVAGGKTDLTAWKLDAHGVVAGAGKPIHFPEAHVESESGGLPAVAPSPKGGFVVVSGDATGPKGQPRIDAVEFDADGDPVLDLELPFALPTGADPGLSLTGRSWITRVGDDFLVFHQIFSPHPDPTDTITAARLGCLE